MKKTSKKDQERACLDRAFELGLRGKGKTKRLLERLSGELLQRDVEERPDFVVRLEGDSGCLLGIEHFVVDQASEELIKQPGIYSGKSVIHEVEARRIYEEYRDDVLAGVDCMQELGNTLAKTMAGLMADQRNSSYLSFIRHFDYTVNKHLRRVNEYRDNVARQCGVEKDKVRIAFLMDIRTDFLDFYINKPSGKVRRCRQGEMPMFEGVVNILESLEGKVDYAILVMDSMITSAAPSVLAIDCGSVRKSLARQGRNIYVFAGSESSFADDMTIVSDFEVNCVSELTDGSVDFVFQCDYKQADPETILTAGLIGARTAWNAKKTGRGFVADIPVEVIMVQFGEDIVGWRKPNEFAGERCAQPVLVDYDSKTGTERLEAFQKKWIKETHGEGAA